MDLVQIATCEIADILERNLPKVSVTWWNDLVWNHLSGRQQEALAGFHGLKLQDLDLSSLLSIVDANWMGLVASSKQRKEGRNYLMELKTIRNELCHRSSRPTSVELALRQWQTLKLFLKSLGGSESAIRIINVQLRHLAKSYQSELCHGREQLLAS